MEKNTEQKRSIGCKVGLPEIELRVVAADKAVIGLHDLFDVMIDEIIKRINVLLHQPPHLHPIPKQESIKQSPHNPPAKVIKKGGNIGRELGKARTFRKAGSSWNLSTIDFTGAARILRLAEGLPQEKQKEALDQTYKGERRTHCSPLKNEGK